jgi:hypothetical protein
MLVGVLIHEFDRPFLHWVDDLLLAFFFRHYYFAVWNLALVWLLESWLRCLFRLRFCSCSHCLLLISTTKLNLEHSDFVVFFHQQSFVLLSWLLLVLQLRVERLQLLLRCFSLFIASLSEIHHLFPCFFLLLYLQFEFFKLCLQLDNTVSGFDWALSIHIIKAILLCFLWRFPGFLGWALLRCFAWLRGAGLGGHVLPRLINLILQVHGLLFVLPDLVLQVTDLSRKALLVLLSALSLELELALDLGAVILHLLRPHLHLVWVASPRIKLIIFFLKVCGQRLVLLNALRKFFFHTIDSLFEFVHSSRVGRVILHQTIGTNRCLLLLLNCFTVFLLEDHVYWALSTKLCRDFSLRLSALPLLDRWQPSLLIAGVLWSRLLRRMAEQSLSVLSSCQNYWRLLFQI